jgi:hypothetical protein
VLLTQKQILGSSFDYTRIFKIKTTIHSPQISRRPKKHATVPIPHGIAAKWRFLEDFIWQNVSWYGINCMKICDPAYLGRIKGAAVRKWRNRHEVFLETFCQGVSY